MATELGKFLDDLLSSNRVNQKDKPFLNAVQGVVNAYLESGSAREGIGSEKMHRKDVEDLDLSKIPYNVDADNQDILLDFISRLDIPYRAKSGLVRYIVYDQDKLINERVEIRSIRDLYRMNEDNQIANIRHIGKKSDMAIRDSLTDVLKTGKMPLDFGDDLLKKHFR